MGTNENIYEKLNNYLAFFENENIQMPVYINFDENELLVLLSLFSKSEIMGATFATESIARIEELVPNVCADMVEKGWLVKEEANLFMCPQVALTVLCMSCAEKTVVFTSDSLQAGQEQLSIYIYRNELFLTMFKSDNSFKIRIDSKIHKMCHYLFNNYLCEEETAFHSDEFICGLSNAFDCLEDESSAIWNGEFIKRAFAFKVFDKEKVSASSVIYNFIQFEETGAGIYEMGLEKLERCDRMYAGSKFYFEKQDYVSMFTNAFEVICNG